MFNILKEINNSQYVSCIKIDGQPILPPLMTPERCLEMQKYKALAVEIEKQKKLKYEQTLNDINLTVNLKKDECCEELSALRNESNEHEIIQSTIYDHVENSSLETSHEEEIQILNKSDSALEISEIPTIDKLNQLLDESEPPIEAPKPTLIRQNSYIIETPSPLLLAYIENNKLTSPPSAQTTESNDKKRRSCWDLTSAKEKWSSFENNLDIAFIPTKVNTKNVKSKISRSVPQSPAPSPELVLPERKKNLKRHSYSAGGSNIRTNPKLVKPVAIYPEVSSDEISDLNARDIYLAIQKQHSKQMAELMIRQKKEQEILLRRLKEQQMLFNEQIKQTYVEAMVQNNLLEQSSFESRTESALCCTKNSISVQTEPSNLLISPREKCFTEPNFETSTQISETKSLETTIVNSDSYETDDDRNKSVKHNNNINIRNSLPMLLNKLQSFKCSRELFPGMESPDTIERVAAAVTIQAYVRGYFVRRLLRTDRVRSLIQTLKDTLLCALDFHNESTDNIEQVDVDLHRRLIQQLTAACYAIHDLFFKLSIKEQMNIINHDRNRLKDKLLRPSSAKLSPLLSTTSVKTIRRKQESPRSLTESTVSNGSLTITNPDFKNHPGNRLTSSLITTSSPINTNTFRIRRCYSQPTNKKPWR